MADLQARAAAWRFSRFPDGEKRSVLGIVAKLTEELGEVARAVVGEIEGRPARGDVADEAAQLVFVALTLIGCYYPERDLLADVEAELVRLETKEVERVIGEAIAAEERWYALHDGWIGPH